MRAHAFALSAALVCTGLTAQSPLTTTFNGNITTSNGNVMYFDLTTAGSPVEINAFDLHFGSQGAAAGVEVYLRPGTFSGNITANDWSKVAQDDGTAVSAGFTSQTNVPLSQPFCIPAQTTVGVALVAGSQVNHIYTSPSTPCTVCTYSNNELTLNAGSSTASPFTGFVYNPRVVNCSIHYTQPTGCTLKFPPSMIAVAEATSGSGTLSRTPGSVFEDNWFIRWNYDDPTSSFSGHFAATVFNIGQGGSAAVGSTPQIPGFDQLWSGSTPSGTAYVFGPPLVGASDASLPIPAGLFQPGDTLRMQGLVLDSAAGGPGLFPVVPTQNTIEFVHSGPCVLTENFDALATGVGNYPTGWSDGGGIAQWQVDTGGTPSSNTGPSAAVSSPNYMYCETSSPRSQGDTFIMNTAVYSTSTLVHDAVAFHLSRIGGTIGTLEIRQGDGTGSFPTVLKTYTGAEPNGVEWTREIIPLQLASGQSNVQLQFHYTRGSSFTGDVAIDDFCMQ